MMPAHQDSVKKSLERSENLLRRGKSSSQKQAKEVLSLRQQLEEAQRGRGHADTQVRYGRNVT
jgi:hypothetical protein